MRIYPAAILFVFLCLSPAESWAEKNYRVVVFGDSITSGYQLQANDAFPSKLERRLRASGYDRLEVINMSKENATTASATEETGLVAQKLPDVIIVQLGYNDTKRGVIASAIASNLNTIISDLVNTKAYIILVGIPAPEGIHEHYSYEVASYFYSIARSFAIPLYPSAIAGIEGNAALTMADGKHPNTAGVDVMVEGLLPLVDSGLRWRYEVYEQELQQAKKNQNALVMPPPP
ncbi:MAG: GDSL-type esterase/lipase family protein [Alphaproteobacteria bacterium]|nr:GDSL-type esterase/lipase family protein [Alphaproteobacteria bacterium]